MTTKSLSGKLKKIGLGLSLALSLLVLSGVTVKAQYRDNDDYNRRQQRRERRDDRRDRQRDNDGYYGNRGYGNRGYDNGNYADARRNGSQDGRYTGSEDARRNQSYDRSAPETINTAPTVTPEAIKMPINKPIARHL